jgi:hypothetical protein
MKHPLKTKIREMGRKSNGDLWVEKNLENLIKSFTIHQRRITIVNRYFNLMGGKGVNGRE